MELVITSKENYNGHITKYVSNLFGSTPYGDYLLLKQMYKRIDIDYTYVGTNPKMAQLIFNTEFLYRQILINGSLTCVYCGKPNLVIYHWTNPNKKLGNMATTDHFNPKSNGGAKFDMDNMVVACFKCNNKKRSKLYSIRTLRHLSFYGDFKTLVKKLIY